jgi:hypothetical protein
MSRSGWMNLIPKQILAPGSRRGGTQDSTVWVCVVSCPNRVRYIREAKQSRLSDCLINEGIRVNKIQVKWSVAAIACSEVVSAALNTAEIADAVWETTGPWFSYAGALPISGTLSTRKFLPPCAASWRTKLSTLTTAAPISDSALNGACSPR